MTDTQFSSFFGKELTEWMEKMDKEVKGLKAMRVYNKCKRAGKEQLAYRIKEKYDHAFIKSDRVMSYFLLLTAKHDIHAKG